MANQFLRIENLSAAYAKSDVLHSITIDVNYAEVVTIIGANGAGKSSILRSISGVIPRASGKIYFADQRIDTLAAAERITRGLVHVPEGRGVFPRLSVKENLLLGAYRRSDKKNIVDSLSECLQLFPILADRRNQLAGTLSGGEQQMLAIARGLMGSPKILMLDEPSMGVAPILIEKIYATLESLKASGMTILLVEQNANLALSLAARAYVIESGRIILSGDSHNLLKDQKVIEAYLGS